MIRPVLLITRRLPDAVLARAETDYEIIVNYDDHAYPTGRIIEMSPKVDGIIACYTERFSADVVAALDPRVRIVANYAVGTDHCDLAAFAARGIAVTNTPDILCDATAETAMLLLLGAARRAVEGDRMVRTGRWDDWSPSFMVGKQVTGARLGIVGMGRIGQAMARNARGFGMQVHYHNRRRLSEDQERGATFHNTLDTLLAVSDFLSLHCPATPQTQGMMTAEAFSRLPEGAVFVNTARGGLVDEKALIDAIESGMLAAAGLDCYVDEPGGNPAFAAYDRIFMLPHIGSATAKTRDAMGFRPLDNLDAFFAGKTPRDLVQIYR
jgi:lactate dehydrogenase-like 2-hydroxyacid dehydrogenase